MQTIITKDLKQYKPVTGGRNGYPVPEIGIFIFADSLEELQQLQEKYNIKDFYAAHWKDGWDFCENPYKLFVEPEIWFKNCVHEDFFTVHDDINNFVKYEILWKLEEVETEEEKEIILKEASDFKNSYKDYDFFTLDQDGNFEAFNFSTSYHYDTHHYQLGIFLSNEEYEIVY